MSGRARFVLRLLVACVVGGAVAGLSLAAAWRGGGDNPRLRYPQWLTLRRIHSIDMALEDHRKKTGDLPGSLEPLRAESRGYDYLNAPDALMDYWGRPLCTTGYRTGGRPSSPTAATARRAATARTAT